ncbi:MAG: sulfurtransferase TusA family protein [Prochlorococcus sp.]|jgi:TusA-related sulfurtransferase|nr:sulfurtransferase TusA family protein [Prochlorococcaceae cyanobacterium ETNP18_MAG_14]MDP6309416.1 sulfurtransferase TusA family protein [Prochlorococcaceae cyanobacterium ETNP14_MAG_4]HJM81104.1 sulfurtransferase TusA family protein [Prochlorococcaceae cyanobacterium Fu_MAG_72]|tara:strand:+ start:1143 stop:1388 length:246 start_codon:yes stop_codon:yes gene_type:complete
MMAGSLPDQQIDLRGISCPKNFIRCRLALEALEVNQLLQVDLDCGEPEEMVVSGLREAGHRVEIYSKEATWLRLMVTCGGG